LLSYSLSNNQFGDETGKALVQALTTSTTLNTLNLLKYGGEMPGLLLCMCSAAS